MKVDPVKCGWISSLFFSWVLTVMLISTIISTKIDVYVGMFTVRVRVFVSSLLKVVLLQVVRVRAPLHQRLSIKSFFLFHIFQLWGSWCWTLS